LRGTTVKLVVHTFLTLDGVMQAPGGPDEDRDGGFEFGGWSAQYWSEQSGTIITDAMGRLDALLLGRKTYDIFAGYWPNVEDDDNPVATRFNAIPKYVVSTTLSDPTWSGTEVISDDVVARIAGLKEQPGNELQVHGSAQLLQTLLDNGLIDELKIFQSPVVLGSGKRLFREGAVPTAYEVTEHQITSTGSVYTVYRPVGPPQPGSMVGA
jgi:dihydrofolate reductase